MSIKKIGLVQKKNTVSRVTGNIFLDLINCFCYKISIFLFCLTTFLFFLSLFLKKYRVVVQSEKYDDWSGSLYELKRLFAKYPKTVLRHLDPATSHRAPKGYISTAAQGNFLEMLNMSLNGKCFRYQLSHCMF